MPPTGAPGSPEQVVDEGAPRLSDVTVAVTGTVCLPGTTASSPLAGCKCTAAILSLDGAVSHGVPRLAESRGLA